MRRLLADFFVDLADRRYADLRGSEAALWLQRFEDEHDNFRSALAYLLDRREAARALGDRAFERAWELGSAMTLDEALAFALEQRAPVPDPT